MEQELWQHGCLLCMFTTCTKCWWDRHRKRQGGLLLVWAGVADRHALCVQATKNTKLRRKNIAVDKGN